METVDIEQWCRQTLSETPVPEGIQIQFDIQAGLSASFDRERMGQAIANLVENACQAMEAEEDRSETSHVRITARRTNGVVELQVLDNGPGIPQEVMPNLFEPLYSTRSFGIGLGLPLVKQIVEEHGGEIHVRSVPNSETTMTIRLPNS